MRFLTNVYDPRRSDARNYFTFSFEDKSDPNRADLEWESYMRWVDKNIIGRPKGTNEYTTDQLEEFGMVGIYAP